eukprot:1148926-Pelagomonas_calceolata.AAC.3
MQFKGLLCVWTWEGCWACDHHVTWWRTESGRPGWLATRKSQAAIAPSREQLAHHHQDYYLHRTKPCDVFATHQKKNHTHTQIKSASATCASSKPLCRTCCMLQNQPAPRQKKGMSYPKSSQGKARGKQPQPDMKGSNFTN